MNLSRLHRGIAGVALAAAFAGTLLAQRTVNVTPDVPDCSPLAGQMLACKKLGFTYKVPFGWVDRTQDMQATAAPDVSSAGALNPSGDSAHHSQSKTLLAVFERPPGTPGDAVNPAVVIAAEDRASYPQVKTAADYLEALAEIAERRGLKMNGDPYSFAVGTKQVARADFATSSGKTAARQTSLVSLQKGYILSFTVLSASDDEIDELIANLTFTAGARKPSPK